MAVLGTPTLAEKASAGDKKTAGRTRNLPSMDMTATAIGKDT
jgi:hypothetical protein